MSNENTTWRTSSYSGSSGDCVQVARVSDGTAVRDSKDTDGPVLTFTADAWRAFVGNVKSGQIT